MLASLNNLMITIHLNIPMKKHTKLSIRYLNVWERECAINKAYCTLLAKLQSVTCTLKRVKYRI